MVAGGDRNRSQADRGRAKLRDALAELWTMRAWSFWMGAEVAAFELLQLGPRRSGGRGARLPRGAESVTAYPPNAPTGLVRLAHLTRIGSMDAAGASSTAMRWSATSSPPWRNWGAESP